MFLNKRLSIEIKAIALLFLTIPLGGCNTFSGMGKDISTSADWAKSKMNSQDSAANQQNTADQSKTNTNQQSTQKTQTTK